MQRMRRALVLAGGAALAGSVVALGGPASAAEETSLDISWVKNNVVLTGAHPDEATIMAKYRCEGTGFHLWASVKQGPGIDEEHTSSADAESWYETPEGPAPVCDGKNHVIRYTVTRVEGFDQLQKGEAWVQFVFFYVDANGAEVRAADVGWAQVKAPGGR